MHSYIIGMGTNENRLVNLRTGWRLLGETGTISTKSWVYESVAVGTAAPPFWNGMVMLASARDPQALKRLLVNIEDMAQRVRRLPDGSTNPLVALDLDILMVDDVVQSPDLFTLAHCVVLLAEIAPDRVDPVTGRTARDLAQALVHTLKPVPELCNQRIHG